MILENKLGITDSVELAKAEEKISKKRAIELFESGYLNYLKPGTFKSLAEIHKYLFGPIYGFAGQIRTVNISKGNFRFAPIMYLEAALENIEKMPQSTYDEIIEKFNLTEESASQVRMMAFSFASNSAKGEEQLKRDLLLYGGVK